jgi:hypothetical protein
MQSNRSEWVRSQLRQPSPTTAITTALVLVAASVGVSTSGIFPLTNEKGIYLPPVTSTVPAGGGETVPTKTKTVRLAEAESVALMLQTSGSPARGAPSARQTGFPNLMDALSHVPVKAKLQVLLTLLVAETDPAERADLQAKLTALLKLPEDVLVQVLSHPELAEFNQMLNAVFLGDTELWWVESQLAKINVIPVTTTTNRIDVSGKPAFIYDSTVAASAAADGGSPTSGLRTLPAKAPEPQVSTMMVTRSVPETDVTTFAAPASSEMQISEFSMSAPVADVAPMAAPAPAPAPAPDPTPAASFASAPTNAEISVNTIETQPTLSNEVFDTGNRFEPETKLSEPVTSNPETTETATAPTPPTAGAEPSADPQGPPSGDTNDDGSHDGESNP